MNPDEALTLLRRSGARFALVAGKLMVQNLPEDLRPLAREHHSGIRSILIERRASHFSRWPPARPPTQEEWEEHFESVFQQQMASWYAKVSRQSAGGQTSSAVSDHQAAGSLQHCEQGSHPEPQLRNSRNPHWFRDGLSGDHLEGKDSLESESSPNDTQNRDQHELGCD